MVDNIKVQPLQSQPFKTVIVCKPAVECVDTDDYHFKIPRKMIRSFVIEPDKFYSLWVMEFDEGK